MTVGVNSDPPAINLTRMLPVIALVGRPNVGKSTLFNALTRSRDALVHDQPGLTRDRLYGRVRREGKLRALVVDTGGLGDESVFAEHIDIQVNLVIEEADEIFFIVDHQQGISPRDEEIALQLRKSGKSIHVVVNKAEGIKSALATAEFQRLGVKKIWPVSAQRGDRVEALLEEVLSAWPEPDEPERKTEEEPIRIAIVGRPNVGKSTLVNAILGENRVIVVDRPGTTRDSITIPLVRDGRKFELVDTAGVRRRRSISETVEQFSVVKTIQAIEKAQVCVLLLDAQREPGDQDAAIAGMIVGRGRSIMVAVNKWDNLEQYKKKVFSERLKRRFPFLPRHDTLTISALHGTAVGNILPTAEKAYKSAMIEFATSDLNRKIERAVEAQSPPMHAGHAIKLKFAHQDGTNPPKITIHGNRLEHIPASYTRYLSNYLQKHYDLVGTRLQITYKASVNPYAQRRAGRQKKR